MTGARINYLRTHRKQCGFTQHEVGFLLGLSSGQLISRYEQGSATPHLRAALACQIVFGAVPHELFPSVHEEVETTIIKRVIELNETLGEQKMTPVIAGKRKSLQKILDKVDAQTGAV
jgi:transcriptional regulator with XRE-family HTH domain